jgi:thiamine biosynthesis lipoprotein
VTAIKTTPPPASTSFRALGTTVSVLTADRTHLEAAEAVTRRHVEALDLAASRFRDDSEITGLRAGEGGTTKVSDLLAELVAEALWAAEVTGGALDPTVGHALELCGYDRDFAEVAPSGPTIEFVARRVPGWRAVRVDTAANTVTVPRGVLLDLGATAKASCADRAATEAARATGSPVLVNIGGDLAVAGRAPAGGWVVRIAERHDVSPDSAGPRVAIERGGLATSGTAARRWQRGGEVLHHVIDPSTGLPAAPCWRTVSVVADTCLAANVAATASVILGTGAPAWLARHRLHARLQHEEGQVVTVGRWPSDEDDGRREVAA